MFRPIARQRLGKHILAGANARNNRPSIARQRISTHVSLTIDAVFSAILLGYEFEVELIWQLQNKGKKGSTLCKEDFMCNLK
jgi:hypothetical protein